MPAAIVFSGKDAQGNTVPTPFQAQLEFFLNKLNLPTERWDDILKSAHDRAFIVAGAAQADLLQELRNAVAGAIRNGTGLAAFQRQFDDIVKRHGWTGWTGEGSAAGRAWRTKVIYQTNMATSYAAGRWKQLTDPELLATRPYWKYVHSDSVLHPRPLHVSWDGLVLPHDHPFWQTHFPPNGWGCQCTVVAVSAKEYAKAQEEGRAEPPPGWDQVSEKTGAPVGIDQGWGYAPGAQVDRPMQAFIDDKLIRLDAPIGAALNEALYPVLKEERNLAFGKFLDEVQHDPAARGRQTVVGAMDTATLHWLKSSFDLAPASASIGAQDALILGRQAGTDTLAGKVVSTAEWRNLPATLAAPEQILFDTRTGELLYIGLATDDGLEAFSLVIDYQSKSKGCPNMVVSVAKLPRAELDANLQDGFLQVVQ